MGVEPACAISRSCFPTLGAYRRDAILGVLFVTAETALELFIPVIMANIIDVGVPAGDINYMLLQGAYMLVCAALSLVLGLGYARTSARVASGLGANLREAEYKKIQTLAFGNLDNYDASSLVTRMTTDITVIQNAVGNGFRPMVRGPVTLIVGLIYALMLSRPLATVFAIILPVLAIVLGAITYRVSPLYRQLQTSMDHLNGVVQEDLTAVRAVKAYVRAEHECGQVRHRQYRARRHGDKDLWQRGAQPAGVSAVDVRGCALYPVDWRPHDSRRQAGRGLAHGLYELRAADHELAHDDFQRVFAAYARTRQCGAASSHVLDEALAYRQAPAADRALCAQLVGRKCRVPRCVV